MSCDRTKRDHTFVKLIDPAKLGEVTSGIGTITQTGVQRGGWSETWEACKQANKQASKPRPSDPRHQEILLVSAIKSGSGV